MWLAQGDTALFLGEDFFAWMVLAFGAAMVVGNLLALLRPPSRDRDAEGRASSQRGADAPESSQRSAGDGSRPGTVERPPLARSLVFIVAGLAAAAWGLATLVA